MGANQSLQHAHPRHVAYYRSGNAIRSRSVSNTVLLGRVDLPALPARLMADLQLEIDQNLNLQPGDVESLPLARARTRWPGYRQSVQAAYDCTRALFLGDVLPTSSIALMACGGARYHHDGVRYGGFAFCNLFLSEDKGQDLHFAATGQRIPLTRGTVVIFDTAQPHAVIARKSSGFDAADFSSEQDCTQFFLTWELPIDNPQVSHALQIDFDVDTATAELLDDAQLHLNGTPISVCPHTGGFLAVAH
jgi:hypothetical protein